MVSYTQRVRSCLGEQRNWSHANQFNLKAQINLKLIKGRQGYDPIQSIAINNDWHLVLLNQQFRYLKAKFLTPTAG